ncbi:MAG: alanine racemase [Gammaproteobacteria bacterium RIFCSPHIGHO2_12_FULL_42_10]|nr:MAG: alanine racemase [Gammaproteobacteria bacterium RIFCSPHIGHO2_12_FULL_42_10]
MTRPAYLTLDLSALQHNFKRISAYAPSTHIMAMVKANAYGHGAVQIARALKKADAFGVASLEEGMVLREAGIQQPVVLLNGLFDESEWHVASRYDFTLVIHQLSALVMLEKIKPDQPFSVWLKINSGMNRLGFDLHEVAAIYQRLMMASAVNKPIGFMTHFSEADDLNSPVTAHQIACFNQATAGLQGPRSLAHSAAIIARPESHADFVRPGLMLYGVSPFANKTAVDFDLKPVMTFSSAIEAIRLIKKGERVSYGGTFVAPSDMLIGIVSLGYGDGYPRAAKNGTPLLVNGRQTTLIGRVCMDMLAVDLRPLSDTKVGDPVVLWGQGLPIEEVAHYNNTFVYEMLSSVTDRPKRAWL